MLLLSGIFVIVAVLANDCYADNKNCDMRELDLKLLPIMGLYGSKEIKLPESEQEIDQWCRSISESINSVKNHAKECLNGQAKTLLSVTIFSANKLYIKQTCKNKIERNQSISRAKCGNRGRKDAARCWDNLIKVISAIKNVTDAKIRIPLVCCSFYEWKTCTIDVYKSIGSPVCSESAIEGYDQFISRGSLDPLNLFCSDYNDESDKCDKIKPLLNKSKSDQLKYKTPFPAIIEVFESL